MYAFHGGDRNHFLKWNYNVNVRVFDYVTVTEINNKIMHILFL